MASVNEEVQDVKIRVFKWNEHLQKIEELQGLLLFRIKKSYEENYNQVLGVFDLTDLSTRDSTARFVSRSFNVSDSFSQDTIARVSNLVSSYLLSCFRFNIQTEPNMRNPIPVIVLDVNVSETRDQVGKRVFSLAFSSEKQALDEDSNYDDVSAACSEVNKRKVGDARNYKKEWKSRMQRKRFPEVEGICDTIRSILDEPLGQPIVIGEPRGLHEVDATMRMKRFDGCESGTMCSICLDKVSTGVMVAITPCKHVFHRDCLFQWLPKTNCCPLCRSVCTAMV